MSSEHLWVYGTLRHGCSNPHARLLREASRYLGPARVQAKLYRIDWYPGIRLGGSPEDWVIGDVFQILDPSTLAELDQYEGSDEYQRVLAEAELVSGDVSGDRVSCWVYEYLGVVSESCRIASGDWLAASGDWLKE
jgi:gamma-glutamylcyclotransferase (GGCT)/AIG2-like uncharacterized protein YtfP